MGLGDRVVTGGEVLMSLRLFISCCLWPDSSKQSDRTAQVCLLIFVDPAYC